mmetsp:Transcript_49649/g.142001  ORF Transcript_49649/g.142001 Transcript_49649/m.142001 type:complete len:497 (-) Transcript_49649:319-1809(-)
MALPPQVSFCLDIADVSRLIAASRSWCRGITRHIHSLLLRRQFGHADGSWLARCTPQRRLEALRRLSSGEAPCFRSCSTVAGLEEHESHTLVPVPRVLWPCSTPVDALGVVLLFGGVHGRSFEPVSTSAFLTVRGDLKAGRLEAACQTLEAEGPPPARFSHAAIWLTELSAMAVYGGRRSAESDSEVALGDLWLFEHVAASSESIHWRWREVGLDSANSAAPAPRSHFASCELSGRSFFIHGGHTCQSRDGLLDDAWICWIDDGFDELDDFGFGEPACLTVRETSNRTSVSRPGSRQVSMSRQLSDQLMQQVSDSYKRLAPQVSRSCSEASSPGRNPSTPEGIPVAAIWRRVDADGERPSPCCGHVATRCRDGVIIYGVWSGSSTAHLLGPVHLLEGLCGPIPAQPGRRPHYSRLAFPCLAASRPLATLHCVSGFPTLVGGWGDLDSLPETTKRAWHASCQLPLHEAYGPLVVVFGGRDTKGNSCSDLLVLSWVPP